MSTADEIMARMNAIQPQVDRWQKALDCGYHRILESSYRMVFGREVGARRARKLRRRGDDVHFFKTTINGKARYRWLPSVPVVTCEARLPLTTIDEMARRIHAAGMRGVDL